MWYSLELWKGTYQLEMHVKVLSIRWHDADIINKLPVSILEAEEKAPGTGIIDDDKTHGKSSWSFIRHGFLFPFTNNVMC